MKQISIILLGNYILSIVVNRSINYSCALWGTLNNPRGRCVAPRNSQLGLLNDQQRKKEDYFDFNVKF